MAVWYVHSLVEYLDKINQISQRYKNESNNEMPILWYRGHEKSNYHLEPGIYRNFYGKNRERNSYNSEETYGTIHQKEDFRYQHFLARNYDIMTSMPGSMIEWQEVMQHYFAKTRLMDWSESALVSLSFALEAYMNPIKDHEVEYKRCMNSPTVWVMNPVKLNQKVYNCFESSQILIENALKGISKQNPVDMMNDLKNNQDIYFHLNCPAEAKMNGIISLSGLEHMCQDFEKNSGEGIYKSGFNPFFYLVLKYYSDGIPVKMEELPPVAIIHPYHSSRIRNQKGAFTVFPYYKEDGVAGSVLNSGFSPYGMEFMSKCKDCLDKIVIMNPYRTAEQLLTVGVKRAHLYPEMENMTKDFENNSYGI